MHELSNTISTQEYESFRDKAVKDIAAMQELPINFREHICNSERLMQELQRKVSEVEKSLSRADLPLTMDQLHRDDALDLKQRGTSLEHIKKILSDLSARVDW